MLKHEACAAAMSSSGVVVDVDPSLRAFQFTGREAAPEDTSETVPSPSVREPFQAVVASLVTVMMPLFLVAVTDDPPVADAVSLTGRSAVRDGLTAGVRRVGQTAGRSRPTTPARWSTR